VDSTAAYLLLQTTLDARKVLGSIRREGAVVWAENLYGPHQIGALLAAPDEGTLIEHVEDVRARRYVTALDARRIKRVPGEPDQPLPRFTEPIHAMLLVNVNYREAKERVVADRLRQTAGVVTSHTMWGPTDIVALVEAPDHEAMRNLICDEIKVLPGVASNTTLYAYPAT
jgi:DNA-binding Lrp family transcriptional regulator